MADGLDRAIGALSQPHGHVSRAQLLRLGLSDGAIKARLRLGRLIRVHVGVYAVGYVRTDPVARAAAAVLACGPGAVLSHASAAALWGFRKRWPSSIEVTTATARRRAGIKVHRSGTLSRPDITRHRGIPVTTAVRTLIDLAPGLSDRQMIRMINEALLSNYLRTADLNGTCLARFIDDNGLSGAPSRTSSGRSCAASSFPRRSTTST